MSPSKRKRSPKTSSPSKRTRSGRLRQSPSSPVKCLGCQTRSAHNLIPFHNEESKETRQHVACKECLFLAHLRDPQSVEKCWMCREPVHSMHTRPPFNYPQIPYNEDTNPVSLYLNAFGILYFIIFIVRSMKTNHVFIRNSFLEGNPVTWIIGRFYLWDSQMNTRQGYLRRPVNQQGITYENYKRTLNKNMRFIRTVLTKILEIIKMYPEKSSLITQSALHIVKATIRSYADLLSEEDTEKKVLKQIEEYAERVQTRARW